MEQAEKTKLDIENAASSAVKTIANAAGEATKVIAQAASEASKMLANNAAEALKVTSVKSGNDHDLLIELKTRMEGLRDDIKALSDGTTTKIANHETRLNALEESKTRQTVLLSIGISVLVILVGLLTSHMFI